MGIEIVRVPPGFEHPTDSDGEFIAGAHHEQLYYLDDSIKSGYQIYENVTEGTPQSPTFSDVSDLRLWLQSQGWDEARVASFIERGHAPSFVVRL